LLFVAARPRMSAGGRAVQTAADMERPVALSLGKVKGGRPKQKGLNDMFYSPTATPSTTRNAAQIARELAALRRVLFRADALSDADVDAIIVAIGADRVLAGIDRYTRPQFAVAAT
jgi:hypothetical protein